MLGQDMLLVVWKGGAIEHFQSSVLNVVIFMISFSMFFFIDPAMQGIHERS